MQNCMHIILIYYKFERKKCFMEYNCVKGKSSSI